MSQESGTTFDTAAAPVGTVFYNAVENNFTRKTDHDTWEIYDTYDAGDEISDEAMRDSLSEDDVRYEATATTGWEPQ